MEISYGISIILIFSRQDCVMENEERQNEEGRRAIHRRKRFDPNYKGWQRRDVQSRRTEKARGNSAQNT
jgi:hypothetical protein